MPTPCSQKTAPPRRRCRNATASGPIAFSPAPAARIGCLPAPPTCGQLPCDSGLLARIERPEHDTCPASGRFPGEAGPTNLAAHHPTQLLGRVGLLLAAPCHGVWLVPARPCGTPRDTA